MGVGGDSCNFATVKFFYVVVDGLLKTGPHRGEFL